MAAAQPAQSGACVTPPTVAWGSDLDTIEFRILKKAGCVHFKGVGNIRFDDLESRIMDVHRHPDFYFSFNTFIDFEDATVAFTDGGLDRYQDFFKRLQRAGIHRKWAIYSTDPLTFQSANMSHLLLSGAIEVDVFERRHQALAFLGLTDADLED